MKFGVGGLYQSGEERTNPSIPQDLWGHLSSSGSAVHSTSVPYIQSYAPHLSLAECPMYLLIIDPSVHYERLPRLYALNMVLELIVVQKFVQKVSSPIKEGGTSGRPGTVCLKEKKTAWIRTGGPKAERIGNLQGRRG